MLTAFASDASSPSDALAAAPPPAPASAPPAGREAVDDVEDVGEGEGQAPLVELSSAYHIIVQVGSFWQGGELLISSWGDSLA